MTEGSFWDHAEALRGVLLRAVGVMLLLCAVAFGVMPRLFQEVILAPCSPDFPLYTMTGMRMQPVELINIRLASQFFIHMSASLYVALVAGMPVIAGLLWGFVSPGLYPDERRGAGLAAVVATVMFYTGVAVGYFLVFPLTLRFLADYQLSPLIPNRISLDSYMDNFLMVVALMGVVFELPVSAWLLGKLGVIHRGLFSVYRRHAIVVLLVLAAVLTPTGDPLTLLVVFIPVYILWELSALSVPRKSVGR